MSEQPIIPAAIPSCDPPPDTSPLQVRLLTLVAIIIPLLGMVSAPFFVWGWGFGWTDLGLLVGMYLATTLGITVGFHRMFVHRSFSTYPWVRFILAVLGSMAVQGALFQWVGMHRRHHQFSDRPEDPHTPHHQGAGILGLLRGFWHAHIGWFFAPDPPDLDRYVQDLAASPSLRVANRLFIVWVALGILIPAIIDASVTASWRGFWTGLIWGGLVRIFLVHHITWSINSACHLWGFRPYESHDMSRNNPLFGILGLGEGWHNTHHAFPSSARHGLRWWQVDVSYWLIRSLAALGLAWDLKFPTKEVQATKRRSA